LTDSSDPVESHHELAPDAALADKNLPAFGGQLVVAPSALSGLLDPSAFDPAAALQPVEHRIERGHVERERALRAGFDQLADLIAVPGTLLDHRQHQQLRAALLDLRGERRRRHMW